MTEPTSTDIFGALINLLTLMTTLAIAIVVHRAARRLAILETEGKVRSAWLSVDIATLGDDRLLEIMDRLFHPDEENVPIETKRKRWACYLLRNPLEYQYINAERHYLQDEERSRRSVEHSLRPLVNDPVFSDLVSEYTNYGPFVRLCQRLRTESNSE